jgi:hypothetical protein
MNLDMLVVSVCVRVYVCVCELNNHMFINHTLPTTLTLHPPTTHQVRVYPDALPPSEDVHAHNRVSSGSFDAKEFIQALRAGGVIE